MITSDQPSVSSFVPADKAQDQTQAKSSPRWWRGLRWLGFTLIGAGLTLIPWLFVLSASLPSTMTASHWSAAWVGFDGLEALGLITTGVLLNRKDPRRCLAAAATSALLVVDAWFDVTTAAPGLDQTTAVAMAAFLEIPLATVCAVLANRTLPTSHGLTTTQRLCQQEKS